jgi:hypothetical protein
MEISSKLNEIFEVVFDIQDKTTKKTVAKIKRLKNPVKAFEVLLELDSCIVDKDSQTVFFDEYYRSMLEIIKSDFYFESAIGLPERYGINTKGNDLVHFMVCFCSEDLITEFFDLFDSNNVNASVNGFDEDRENAMTAAKRLNRDKVVGILSAHGAF